MAASDSGDLFEALHSLEETFYQEGYEAGVTDGSRAGRIEGRVFGLEKGFEKFLELGRLSGKAEVWKQRIHETSTSNSTSGSVNREETTEQSGRTSNNAPAQQHVHSTLPFLATNPRLEKHIDTLHGLVEPATYDTRNNEDAVADFDDRYKRAKAKVKVIEKIAGEDGRSAQSTEGSDQTGNLRRDIRISREQGQEKNMEDFGRSLASRSVPR